MIECKVINGETCTSINGDFEEIVGDTGRILISIYQALFETDEDAVDTFVTAIHVMTNPDFFYRLKDTYLGACACVHENRSKPVEEDTNV